jgi:hypothetical protein
METDQIMDNLIRAYNGLPMLHMDYSSITGTISQTPSGQLSGSTQTTPPVTNTIAYVLGFSQSNQLTVTANPVVDKPDVYSAYLDFVGKPNRLMVTPDPPTPGAAHLVRCYGGSYYWVPAEYRIDFLDLALKTTVMRGQPATPPLSIDRKVIAVTGIEGSDVPLPANPSVNYQYTVTATLDQPVKNDGGTIVVAVDGAKIPLARMLVDDVSPGTMTSTIRFRYHFGPDVMRRQIAKKPDDFKTAINGQAISIFPSRYKPEVPTTEKQLDAIRHELDLIRLNGLH